jgi:hypothetical protein
MANKLSTKEIKKLMCTWMAKLDKRRLEHYATPYAPTQEQQDELATDFGFRKGATSDELLDHIYKIWCDGEQWTRDEKKKLGAGWIEWLATADYDDPAYQVKRKEWIDGGRQGDRPDEPWGSVVDFNIDVIGGQDDALLAKYSGAANEHLARKCFYRLFTHKNDHIANNFRLEVVTTPEDDAVIGWCVTVD